MSQKKKLSTTFELLRALGFNYSEEEYGDVSLWRVIWQFFHNIRQKHRQNMMDWAILEPFAPRKLRPRLMRKMGCHVGEGCFIGDHVRIDQGHADMITLEDGVSVASGTRLLCHQRDFKDYFVGSDYNKLLDATMAQADATFLKAIPNSMDYIITMSVKGGNFVKLQQIQQLVANLGKMVANYFCCFFIADTLTHLKHLENRHCNVHG